MAKEHYSALISQKEFTNKAFRQAASKLSFVKAKPRKDEDGKILEWCWQFDLSKDVTEEEIQSVLHGFGDADIRKFVDIVKNVYPKASASSVLSFDDFIRDCAKNIQYTNLEYTVAGDLVDGFSYPSERDETFAIFDLMASHNTKRKVQVIVTGKTVIDTEEARQMRQEVEIAPDEFVERFSDSSVEVSGVLRFYQGRAAISLWAKEIRWMGASSRIQEREDAEKRYSKYFKTMEEQKRFALPCVKKIGVITGGTEKAPCQGAMDFANKIYRKSGIEIQYAYVNSNDVREVIQKIGELDASGLYDTICIVRGGGDKEDLCQYSSPALLNAIHAAKTPIVTGIGHANDDLLCNRMADYDAGTPTGAANFINKEAGRIRKAEAERNGWKERTEQKHLAMSLQEEKAFLLEEIEELQGEVARLKAENERLCNQKENGGFFRRLFGRF